jgi:hypothetical protein
MNSNMNNCTDNARFWNLIYSLQKTRKTKNLNLTSQQRFALCNYMNGRLYDKKVLKQFI